MNERAYTALAESAGHVDADPVNFAFTEEEVEMYDVTVGKERGLAGERVCNLSENGYPYMRAALFFCVLDQKT